MNNKIVLANTLIPFAAATGFDIFSDQTNTSLFTHRKDRETINDDPDFYRLQFVRIKPNTDRPTIFTKDESSCIVAVKSPSETNMLSLFSASHVFRGARRARWEGYRGVKKNMSPILLSIPFSPYSIGTLARQIEETQHDLY